MHTLLSLNNPAASSKLLGNQPSISAAKRFSPNPETSENCLSTGNDSESAILPNTYLPHQRQSEGQAEELINHNHVPWQRQSFSPSSPSSSSCTNTRNSNNESVDLGNNYSPFNIFDPQVSPFNKHHFSTPSWPSLSLPHTQASSPSSSLKYHENLKLSMANEISESAFAPVNGSTQAFAKLQGKEWHFYVQSLSVSLGRNFLSELSTANPQDFTASIKKGDPDVALGPSKLISRRHGIIQFNFATRYWEFICLGRNGARINDCFISPESMPVPLSSQ